jgi:enoyl-CoA hydratase
VATLTVSKQDGVYTILLNRPEALNAVNPEMLDELDQALDVIEADEETRLVVFAGTGGKAFCAGADVASMIGKTPQEGYAWARKGQSVYQRIEDLPFPSIACVNGAAFGGGCELALACDIRIASAKAVFGQPEAALGITPGWGATQRITRLIGRANAMEFILTGRTVGAEEAAKLGLVNKVVPPEQIWDEVKWMTEAILSKAADAVCSVKLAINCSSEAGVRAGCELEAALFGNCFGPEQRERMSAFVEKRKPRSE